MIPLKGNMLIKHPEWNYIAIIQSQLHLNSFRAFYLTHKEDHLKGLIIRLQSNDGSIFFSNADLSFIPPDDYTVVDYFKRHKSSTIGAKLCSTLAEIITLIINPVKIRLYSNSSVNRFYLMFCMESKFDSDLVVYLQKNISERLCVVVLEEGLGNYIRDDKHWVERSLEDLNSKFEKRIQRIKRSYRFYFNTKAFHQLKRQNRLEKFYLFNKTNHGLTKNDSVCQAFATAFYEQGKYLSMKQGIYRNALLINTQPFFEELGVTVDIDLYRDVCRICAEYGVNVVIKPHPREQRLDRYKSLNAYIETYNRVCQESLLAVSEDLPVAVVGFFSTTLVTSNIYYSIPSITLGRCLDCTKLSVYKDDIENFISTFSSQLIIPNNMSDFETAIRNIVNR